MIALFALGILLGSAPASAAGPVLTLHQSEGWRSNDRGRTALYHLEIGDATAQLALTEEASRRFVGVFSPFAQNAALYLPKKNGGWMVRDFRIPRPEERAEYEAYKDRPAQPGRPTFRDFLLSSWASDFGEKGEFVYQRLSIPQSELPEPFVKLGPHAFEPIRMLQQFHGDGSILVFLREPFDEEGNAQKALKKLADDIESAQGGR